MDVPCIEFCNCCWFYFTWLRPIRLHIMEYKSVDETKTKQMQICVHYAVYNEWKINIGIISISIWFGVPTKMRFYEVRI